MRNTAVVVFTLIVSDFSIGQYKMQTRYKLQTETKTVYSSNTRFILNFSTYYLLVSYIRLLKCSLHFILTGLEIALDFYLQDQHGFF